jgi:hypothetical protein
MKYKHLRIVVDAVQWKGTNWGEVHEAASSWGWKVLGHDLLTVWKGDTRNRTYRAVLLPVSHWLVREQDGRLYENSPSFFDAYFAPTEEKGTKVVGLLNSSIFDAFSAIKTELDYQDKLPIRTADEAQDVPGFLTLLRRYTRKVEDAWADNGGVEQPDGSVQVEEALHGLRKLAAIAVRAMIYNGVRSR